MLCLFMPLHGGLFRSQVFDSISLQYTIIPYITVVQKWYVNSLSAAVFVGTQSALSSVVP